ncbi:hypothetical protein JCM4914_52940 [Streptomyces platensis subsp. malvinus]
MGFLLVVRSEGSSCRTGRRRPCGGSYFPAAFRPAGPAGGVGPADSRPFPPVYRRRFPGCPETGNAPTGNHRGGQKAFRAEFTGPFPVRRRPFPAGPRRGPPDGTFRPT